MSAGRIRVLAIALIRRGGDILVAEGFDTIKPETFYRPLGGAIEFGERAEDALRRELREEIGAELQNVRYLFATENRFTHQGQPGHEIVLVFEATFANPELYDRASMTGHEDGGVPFTALWKPISDFGPGGPPLYPDGLLERIETPERGLGDRTLKGGA